MHKADLPVDKQRTGCDQHRYIPILLAKFAEPVDMDHGDAVVYKMGHNQFVNGDPEFNASYISSKEIHACHDKTALVDDFALDLRLQHKARFV